jgi:predicted phosphodiesterase
MAAKPISLAIQQDIVAAAHSGADKQATADRLNLNVCTVRKYWPKETAGSDSTTSENGNTSVVTVQTFHPIKTYDEAIAAAKVDLTVWYVERWEATAWTVGMKIRNGQDPDTRLWKPEKPLQTQQHGVKLWLRRIAPKAVLDALDLIYGRLAKHAPKYPQVKRPRSTGEPFLGVLGLFDIHFGKLAWADETGDSYDLKIAEQVYRNAVDDLIAEAGGRNIERWLLPIGNDFFHIDNAHNTTAAGTPQDADGRYAKIIAAGEAAVVSAIESMRAKAPVDVIWVPGNHDTTTSYHLARTMAAWFRQTNDVKVDYGPSPRKYYHWHQTLIGLTHGNEEKHDILPSLMSTERPHEWAASSCHEWLLGHMHRSRQWQTKPIDTYQGTVIRVLPSLTGTDAWHYRKGYVGSKRASEIYFYGRDRGYAGHSVVNARIDQP